MTTWPTRCTPGDLIDPEGSTEQPHRATTQTEDLNAELTGVTLLELGIVPDIGAGPARASLARLLLA